MKLSTLLLSSAAILVAGSAYAADLPAKKGAPAAKATGCSAFGAGFFQIPGGDNCIQFSGFMRYEGSQSGAAISQAGSARVQVDVRSNTEMGALRGVVRQNFSPATSSWTSGNTTGASTANGDRAFVQLGGLTAGAYGSTADIATTATNNVSTGLGGGSSTGIRYATALGAFTVTVAAENAADKNQTTYSASTPDLLMAVAAPIGGGTATVVAASHKNDIGQGWAYLANFSVAAGPATVGLYGGVSHGAIAHVGAGGNNPAGAPAQADSDGTNMTDATAFGVSAAVQAAANGTLQFDYGQRNSSNPTTPTTRKNTYAGVGYAYAAAKGFTVTPEYQYSITDDVAANTVYLRIQRDF